MGLWIIYMWKRLTVISSGLHDLVMLLPLRTFLRILGKADSHPIMLTPIIYSCWIFIIRFLFLQGAYPNTLAFWKKILVNTSQSWEFPWCSPLLSWGVWSLRCLISCFTDGKYFLPFCWYIQAHWSSSQCGHLEYHTFARSWLWFERWL